MDHLMECGGEDSCLLTYRITTNGKELFGGDIIQIALCITLLIFLPRLGPLLLFKRFPNFHPPLSVPHGSQLLSLILEIRGWMSDPHLGLFKKEYRKPEKVPVPAVGFPSFQLMGIRVYIRSNIIFAAALNLTLGGICLPEL